MIIGESHSPVSYSFSHSYSDFNIKIAGYLTNKNVKLLRFFRCNRLFSASHSWLMLQVFFEYIMKLFNPSANFGKFLAAAWLICAFMQRLNAVSGQIKHFSLYLLKYKLYILQNAMLNVDIINCIIQLFIRRRSLFCQENLLLAVNEKRLSHSRVAKLNASHRPLACAEESRRVFLLHNLAPEPAILQWKETKTLG